mgnify:CR=1 FL=1
MSKICTLIAIPDTIVEGSTYDILNRRWPLAACHDGVNKVFNSYDGEADTYLIVADEFKEVSGESDYIGRLVVFLSPILFADNREQPIHILKPIMSQLFRHPAYRLYCGNYQTVEELAVDYQLVFSAEPDTSKDLATLNAESRVLLKQILG